MHAFNQKNKKNLTNTHINHFSSDLLDVHNFERMSPYSDCENFLKKSALAAHAFPEEIRSKVYDFKNNGNQEGYLLIRGLKQEDVLIDTPSNMDEIPQHKKTFVSEFWLSAFGSLLGDPFS